MANPHQSRSENIPGNFFVDETCIDCETCRWLSPHVFQENGGKSAVFHQPENLEQERSAYEALVSCPTASIGTHAKSPLLKEVASAFPLCISDNVFYCGFHSEKSYGAASYLIQRKEGNVLVDSPRFAAPLVKKIEAMGGVRYLYLTHQDDVADHALFQRHFQCERILHKKDISPKTQSIEVQLTGLDPFPLASDLLIIPVPGHTSGHTVLLYQNKFLFTGDHLAYSSERQQLIGFRSACWYSWSEQIQSMEKLLSYSFAWVLPGHGRRFSATPELMKKELQKCIEWMKK